MNENTKVNNPVWNPPGDMINHPPHYNTGKIEVIDYIEDKNFGPHLANVIKYVSRAGIKDPNPVKTIQDLEKAEWYLRRHINNLKAQLERSQPAGMMSPDPNIPGNVIVKKPVSNGPTEGMAGEMPAGFMRFVSCHSPLDLRMGMGLPISSFIADDLDANSKHISDALGLTEKEFENLYVNLQEMGANVVLGLIDTYNRNGFLLRQYEGRQADSLNDMERMTHLMLSQTNDRVVAMIKKLVNMAAPAKPAGTTGSTGRKVRSAASNAAKKAPAKKAAAKKAAPKKAVAKKK